MKRQIRLHVLAATIACMAPLGFAQARDLIPAAVSEFQKLVAMPKTQADELAMQRSGGYREPLYKDFTIYDVPRDVARMGAFGPIREEENPQAVMARTANQNFWDSFYPIGGQGTP